MKRDGYTITDYANWYDFSHKKWNGRNGNKITRIIPHHMAGQLNLNWWLNMLAGSRQMSPTVAVFSDGTVLACVPEEMRPWTTGGWDADCCALTLEIENDGGANWHISDKAYNKAVQICAEWCKRYGIDPVYTYRGNGINMHKDWAATACPGDYLEQKIKSGQFERDIRAILNPTPTPAPTPTPTKVTYKVQVGAFKVKANADALVTKLKAKGFDCFVRHEDDYYKVQCGAFSKKANAQALQTALKNAGFKAIIKEVK